MRDRHPLPDKHRREQRHRLDRARREEEERRRAPSCLERALEAEVEGAAVDAVARRSFWDLRTA